MINKGDSVYYVFKDGNGVMDSQGKQYVYKSECLFERYFPFHNNPEPVELVEYAPVKRGKWIVNEKHNYEPYCSICDCEPIAAEKTFYCPSCGAKMDLEG